jgi:hypothetical protein
MKNIIIIIGFFLIVLNTTVGLIFSDYQQHNLMFANASILLSTLVMYTSYQISIADGFKIGFTLLFMISGIIRLICSIVSPDHLADNIAFLIFICFVAVEWILIFVGHTMRDK